MTIIQGERSIVIEAPVEIVYQYICDFTRHTEWNHQPTRITKVTEGPTTVGSIFRAEERAPGQAPWFVAKIMLPVMWKFVGMKGYTEATITAMEDNHCLKWNARAPGRDGNYMEADWELQLEAQGGAKTRVTQRYCYMPKRDFMDGMSERMAEQIKEEVGVNLAVLKAKLENRA